MPRQRQKLQHPFVGDRREPQLAPQVQRGARSHRSHLRTVSFVKKYAAPRALRDRDLRGPNLSRMDDALGETRAGRALGLLATTHFETVDRALWACFNLVDSARFEKSDFVRRTMLRARATDHLFVKKFFILSGICMFEEMRSHYKLSCDAEKFDWWYGQLQEAFRMFFYGDLKRKEQLIRKVCPFDTHYPTLELFVVKMVAAYLTG
jgi:hypothetical protein